jgi:hypothetical protein
VNLLGNVRKTKTSKGVFPSNFVNSLGSRPKFSLVDQSTVLSVSTAMLQIRSQSLQYLTSHHSSKLLPFHNRKSRGIGRGTHVGKRKFNDSVFPQYSVNFLKSGPTFIIVDQSAVHPLLTTRLQTRSNSVQHCTSYELSNAEKRKTARKLAWHSRRNAKNKHECLPTCFGELFGK